MISPPPQKNIDIASEVGVAGGWRRGGGIVCVH